MVESKIYRGKILVKLTKENNKFLKEIKEKYGYTEDQIINFALKMLIENKAKKSKKSKTDTVIKLLFRLYDGRVLEIQTSDEYLLSIVDDFSQLDLKENDEVFRIVE